uniref:Tudor domain-containing protein 5 n=1 Tax=Scleropages formosus TaxID=113540 RepID=A0A8C9V670_SCLFO
MTQEQLLRMLKKDVRSLLVSANGGLTAEQLKRDYKVMLGHPLPLQPLGYRNVLEMVGDMPDVVAVSYSHDGGLLLKAVGVESTKRIEELVSKQRSSKHKVAPRKTAMGSSCSHSLQKNPVKLPCRGHAPPAVPVQLRSQLQQLLSQGPVLLSELESSFARRFGWPLQITHYGFNSIAEMLVAVSDIVTVKQSRMGSVISLQSNMVSPQPTKQSPADLEVTCAQSPEELRKRIFECGATVTVRPELKEKLCQISLHTKLNSVVQRLFDEDLPVSECGFLSVTEMVGALSDTFYINAQHGLAQEPFVALNPPKKTVDFSCVDSSWEGQGNEEVAAKAVEAEADLKVSNKTFHQMLDIFPALAAVAGDEPVVPLDIVQEKLWATARPQERMLVGVLVERVVSPNHFYVRFDETTESSALENMMIEMRSCYTHPEVSDRYQLLESFVRPSQVCCLRVQDIWFYRVVIHRILNDTQVEVYFVDFGDVTTVDWRELKFLKSCYAQLPAQAVLSSLAGIRPISGNWSKDAVRYFQKLCFERPLVAAIHSYQEDVLYTFLCDTHTEEDVYIHNALLAEGHAVQCMDSYSEDVKDFSLDLHYFSSKVYQAEILHMSILRMEPRLNIRSCIHEYFLYPDGAVIAFVLFWGMYVFIGEAPSGGRGGPQ